MQDAFGPLCTVWHEQVKEFFTNLHGHQSKVLAMFVWGAIQAQSIVLQRVAEALLAESNAKCPSIERRLQRFISNERVEVEETWEPFLRQVLPYWKGKKVYIVLDITPFDEHAEVVYIGLLQQTRVLPLGWEVMPGQDKWEEGLWEIVEKKFEMIKKYLGSSDCTVIADSGFGHLPLVKMCQRYQWHYLIRVKKEYFVQRWIRGKYQAWQPLSEVVSQVGQKWSGTAKLWKGHKWETQLSAIWEEGNEDAWFLISDQKAGKRRISEYRWRMRVESTFEDMKSRGWHWESTLVRERDRLDRLLLVLFLCFWWLIHLAASCIHHGRRDRFDRHDRRDKSYVRLGWLYLQEIVRNAPPIQFLKQCLLFRKREAQWHFSLRF